MDGFAADGDSVALGAADPENTNASAPTPVVTPIEAGDTQRSGGVMTRQGRAHSKSLVEAKVRATIEDLRAQAQDCQAELSSSATSNCVMEQSRIHGDMLSSVQALIEEWRSLTVDESDLREVDRTLDAVLKESADFSAFLRGLLVDQSEVLSHKSGRSHGSAQTSASSQKRMEARIELAKRKAEEVAANELAEMRLQKIALDARMEKVARKRDIESLEAEITAMEQIEEEQETGVKTRLKLTTENCLPVTDKSDVIDHMDIAPKKLNPHAQSFRSREIESRSETFMIVEMMKRQAAFSHHIEPFTGNPIHFRHFWKRVEDIIERNLPDSRSRYNRLLEVVQGDPRLLIEGCGFLPDEECYDEAKRLLAKRFGGDLLVTNKFMEELRAWPLVKDNCEKAIGDFYSALLRISSVIDVVELNSPRFIGDLLSKLSFRSRNTWRGIAAKVRRVPGQRETFKDFLNLVEDLWDRASDPVYGEDAIKSNAPLNVNHGNKSRPESNRSKTNPSKQISAFAVSTSKIEKEECRKCLACERSHDASDCQVFNSKSVEERTELVRSERACFGCLQRGHISRRCPNRMTCSRCQRKHPTSLHRGEVSPSSSVVTAHAVGLSGSVVPMSVVRVKVSLGSKTGKVVEGLALLDALSSGTFASSQLLEALGVSGPKTRIAIHTLNGQKTETTEVITGLQVQKPDGNGQVILGPTYAREVIPLQENEVATVELLKKFSSFNALHQDIAKLDMSLPVILLIGADNPLALRPLEVRVGDEGDPLSPYAVRTHLGWSVMGPMKAVGATRDSNDVKVSCHRTLALPNRIVGREVIKDLGVAEMLANLAGLDFTNLKLPPSLADMISSETLSDDDLKFMGIVEAGTRFVEGRYEVPLPIKNRPLIMADSRDMAKRRAISIMKKISRNKEVKEDYFLFMGDLLKNEYARTIDPKKLATTEVGQSHYIPHHCVYHPRKGKIRVVFNCANQVDGLSLNDGLLTGPDLTNQLVGVFLRFRKEPIAFTADVTKMFYQVLVPEDDRNYLRFWWYQNNDESQDLVEYEMTRHLFGGRSSPGCANYALKRTALDQGHDFTPESQETVFRNFYVDDCLKSVETVDKAVSIAMEVVALCKRGGFELTKFLSNSRDFLNRIPESGHDPALKTLQLDTSELPTERALGVLWHVEDDTLGYKVEMEEETVTKRAMLAAISGIYDPIGAAAAFVLPGRFLMQEACGAKIGWDDKVPLDLEEKWRQWRNTLPNLSHIRIPRSFKPMNFGSVRSCELHTFADGSTKAYGAVSFLRLEDTQGQVHVSFVAGKARVAPSQSSTVPRMELVGALLASTMANQVVLELGIDNLSRYFWTDSMVVLGYVKNESKRFHLFVANRVRKIRELTRPIDWRHVDTRQNPADDASRGLSCTNLVMNHRWLRGPDFLWDSTCPWRENDDGFEVDEEDPEVKRIKVVRRTKAQREDFLQELIHRHSSWLKLRKTVAVWLQFIDFLKTKLGFNQTQTPVKTSVEILERASEVLLRWDQTQAFEGDFRTLESFKTGDFGSKRKLLAKSGSPLARLDPFTDDRGLLRVGGRLSRLVNEDVHPIILPKSSQLTKLVVDNFHQQVAHGGRGTTINAIRQGGFWVLGLNTVVRSFIDKCLRCRILRGRTEQPKMADLPIDRLQDAPPFTFVGVDYFGPFIIKNKRKEEKRYGVIFSCLSSRSVHIEVAHSMDTSSYINALRRMIARRGPIRLLRSDNGLNFVGGERELSEALREMDHKKIATYLNDRGADYEGYRRNPPTASNFGGVWERQIPSIRTILAALMMEHGHVLNDETFATLICEVEAIVNARPLTVDCLSDASSPMPLSPSMLLTQKTKVMLPPPGEFQKTDVYCRRQWRRTQFLADQFWRRFRREYLDSLQARPKWNKERENLRVGDLVLLKEENVARNSWKLASIQEVFSDKDGVVRSVKIRVGDQNPRDLRTFRTTEYHRPVNKLVLLKRSEPEELPDEGASEEKGNDGSKPPPDFDGSQMLGRIAR